MDDVPPAEEQRSAESTRRSFHVGAIYAIGAFISAALSLPAIAYLLLPPKAKKADEWIEIGDVTRLTPNAPVEMSFRRNRVDGWKIISEKSTAWVVKGSVKDANSITAFGPQCTHLGCAYHWEEAKNEFLCPCHSSLFGMDGTVKGGPAPRPLDQYEVKVVGKKLLLGSLRQSPEKTS
jgi:menaquinol-cytochrome c reductase iron-sulfur subunit